MSATTTTTRPGGDCMSYTDTVDAPPARGVPERDIWPDAPLRADRITGLNRDLDGTGWHAFEASDSHRTWVSRVTGGPGAVPGRPWLVTGCGEAHDEDNPALMRRWLERTGVLAAPDFTGAGWLDCEQVGELFGVSVASAATYARRRRFGQDVAVMTAHGWRFRAAEVRAVRAAA